MARKKEEFAVLWRKEGQYGITLDLPIMMFKTDGTNPESGFKKIEDLELPQPMTSTQFNKFTTSDEGKEWARPILEKHMLGKGEAS